MKNNNSNVPNETGKEIFEALKTGDIEKLEVAVGRKIQLNTFYDLLKYSSCDRTDEELDKVIIGEPLREQMKSWTFLNSEGSNPPLSYEQAYGNEEMKMKINNNSHTDD